MYKFFLLLFISALFLAGCKKDTMEVDATTFVEIKCKLQTIDARAASGELNFLETEDEKEPLFDSLDILRIRYRNKKEEFDSLIVIKDQEVNCNP